MNIPRMKTQDASFDDGAEHRAWVGRERLDEDVVSASLLRAMSATLDRPAEPTPGASELPPLWHWALFQESVSTAELAIDGHAAKGDFLPPVALPRRMWAGGELTWSAHNPLVIGEPAHRRSRIGAVECKQGRSGNLVFVRLEHRIENARGHVLTEVQNIVYRDKAGGGQAAPAEPAPTLDAQVRRTVVPSELLLFRYSALTFNAHRIHYDQPYAVREEGYQGLVVHGPLIATLLADLLSRHWAGRNLHRFEFRAVKPSFVGEPLILAGLEKTAGEVDLWAHDTQGRIAMKARASLA